MRIAIVGAGICGLATAVHFLAAQNNNKFNITIFDPAPLGENASGLSAGLLHPFPGAHAKLVRNGWEGQKATLELVSIAEKALGEKIAERTGLLRIAISPEQKKDFKNCAKQYPDAVRWVEASECQQLIPSIFPNPGIFIESAYVIQTKQYLRGLWKHCERAGVVWQSTAISSLDELAPFDFIVVAAGAAVKSILSDVSIKPIKGQMLELEWPSSLPPLPFPVNSQTYLVMSLDQKSCFAGATFERSFSTAAPDLAVASAYLHPKIISLIPALKEAKVLNCLAGLRAATPQHQPLVQKAAEHCWVISGMGSKGLLYHALYAAKLVREVCSLVT